MGKGKWFLKKAASLVMSAAMVVTLIPAQSVFADESTASTTLPDKLVYLSFDTAISSEGDVATAALAGGTSATISSTDKKVGDGALDLSNSSYLTVKDADGNNPITGKDEITISYYSKVGADNAGWVYHISKDTSNTYKKEHYLGIIDKSTGIEEQRWNNSGARKPTITYANALKGWKLVTVVMENNATTLYIDGAKIQTLEDEPLLTDILGSSSAFQIGKANWGNGEYYSGLIDDFTVYDGALTSDQVASVYLANASDEEQKAYLISQIEAGLKDVDKDCVTDNLKLLTGIGGVDITWTSSAPDKIDTDGTVKVKDGSTVTLTAAVNGETIVAEKVTLATSATVKWIVSGTDTVLDTKTIDSLKANTSYTYDASKDAVYTTSDGKTYVLDSANSVLTIGALGTPDANNITLVYLESAVSEQAETVAVETREGIAPVLPAEVLAKYTVGDNVKTAVTWDEITADQYAKAGTFEATGKFTGTDVTVKATVTVKKVSDYLLASYSFDEADGTSGYADTSNHKSAAEAVDTVTTIPGLSGNAVQIPGQKQNAGSIKLPENLLEDTDGEVQDDFTVSMFVRRDANLAGKNSFAMLLHADVTYESWNTASRKNHIAIFDVNGGQNNGLWAEYNNKTATDRKVNADPSTATGTGEWAHIALVTKGSTNEAWMYVNGVQYAYSNDVDVHASDLSGRLNYLGKTTWADIDFAGAYDEFAVYNTALTADEVKGICDPTLYESQLAQTKDALTVTYKDTTLSYDPTAVTSDLVLPTTGEEVGAGLGTKITWESSNTAAITNKGVVVRPSADEEDAKVTLTATISAGSYTDTKTFDVTVKKADGVNFTGLKTAIAEANEKLRSARKENIYTDASLKVWDDAIKEAQNVADTEGVEGSTTTSAEVKDATDALNVEMAKELTLKSLDELNSALAAWYPLTTDAADATDHGNDGTATGVTFSRENGAEFNGTAKFTSYIDIPTEVFNRKDQMTISFWAYDDRDGKQSNVFGFSNGTDGKGWADPDKVNVNNMKQFYVNTNDPAGYFRVSMNPTGWKNPDGFSGESSELALATKTWVHITAVLNGHELTVYRDGRLVGTKTISQSVSEIGEITLATIGTCVYAVNGDWDYNGCVRDFRVYDATLAADQVKAVYNYMDSVPMKDAKSDIINALGATVADDGTVSLNVTTDTITLPTEACKDYSEAATVTWESSDAAVINAETGAVTLPESADDAAKTATLTATITKGGETAEVKIVCEVYVRNDIDTTALSNKIAEIEAAGLKEAEYTTATWAAFKTALEEANAQVAKPKSDDKVAAALEKLTTAYEALVKRADMSALNALITKAETDYTQSAYTSTSWKALTEKLAAAKTVAADLDSAESAITTAAKDLQAAIDGLEKRGDKKALQAAINEANTLDEAAYTTASFADVKTALEAAVAVNQNADATEKDVADAEKALKDAVSALVRLGDKTDLKAAIAAAKELNEADYTAESFKAFKEALTAAETTDADAQASEADVAEAIKNLTGATEKLVTVAAVAKEVLDAEIAKAEVQIAGLNEADYTADSWKVLTEALQAAKNIAADASADDITKATEALQAAAAGLKKAEKPVDTNNKDNNNNNANNNNNTNGGAAGDNNQNQTPAPEVVKLSSIKVAAKSYKIAAGKKVTITPEVAPENAANKAVTYESSNTKYATVNEKGVVTTKKAGAGKSVTIKVTAADGSGVTTNVKVTIMKNAVKKIKLTAKRKTVKAGKKLTVKAKVTTTGKKVNKTLAWSSSNEKYATVNQKGVVKATKAGAGKTVTITARSTDGTNKKAAIKIKIKK